MVRASNPRPEDLVQCLMPPNTLRVHSEYVRSTSVKKSNLSQALAIFLPSLRERHDNNNNLLKPVAVGYQEAPNYALDIIDCSYPAGKEHMGFPFAKEGELNTSHYPHIIWDLNTKRR
ncbi:hypothetical protein TNCV_3854791 [Trichonephila clavipes]|nr:hypothetical protein TNCV_3854791 [Trichonephila clavipes]